MKEKIPLLASAFNILGGIQILFLLDYFEAFLGFDPNANILSRFFVAGAAFVFGAAYYLAYKNPTKHLSALVHGAYLKLWAFAISVYALSIGNISVWVFVAFGVGNLLFGLALLYYAKDYNNSV